MQFSLDYSAPKKVRKKLSVESMKTDARPGTPLRTKQDHFHHSDSEKIAIDSITKEQKLLRHTDRDNITPAHHNKLTLDTNTLNLRGQHDNISRGDNSKPSYILHNNRNTVDHGYRSYPEQSVSDSALGLHIEETTHQEKITTTQIPNTYTSHAKLYLKTDMDFR